MRALIHLGPLGLVVELGEVEPADVAVHASGVTVGGEPDRQGSEVAAHGQGINLDVLEGEAFVGGDVEEDAAEGVVLAVGRVYGEILVLHVLLELALRDGAGVLASQRRWSDGLTTKKTGKRKEAVEGAGSATNAPARARSRVAARGSGHGDFSHA